MVPCFRSPRPIIRLPLLGGDLDIRLTIKRQDLPDAVKEELPETSGDDFIVHPHMRIIDYGERSCTAVFKAEHPVLIAVDAQHTPFAIGDVAIPQL